jgi:hypothetical protein
MSMRLAILYAREFNIRIHIMQLFVLPVLNMAFSFLCVLNPFGSGFFVPMGLLR